MYDQPSTIHTRLPMPNPAICPGCWTGKDGRVNLASRCPECGQYLFVIVHRTHDAKWQPILDAAHEVLGHNIGLLSDDFPDLLADLRALGVAVEKHDAKNANPS